MNRFRVLGAGFLILFSAGFLTPADGQQVTLILRQPAPNQLSIADLWQETITYISSTGAAAPPITVRMVGTITDLSQRTGLIVQASTSTFTLSQGTRVMTSQSINVAAPISVVWRNQKVRDALGSNGQFPTGQYQLCVTVIMRGANGEQTLANECITQLVEVTSPPILIAPVSESIVELKYPIFTWTPPVPNISRSRLQYVLKLVEIHGRQTAGSAMQTNPAWLEQPVPGGTTIQYPPAARGLTPGRRYAWMVLASSVDGAPMGSSEVWEFTFQPAKTPSARIATGPIQAVNRIDVLEELLRSCREDAGARAPLTK